MLFLPLLLSDTNNQKSAQFGVYCQAFPLLKPWIKELMALKARLDGFDR